MSRQQTRQHKHGDIYWVALDPTIGSEMKKTRPCLIIFHDLGNQHMDRTVIVPFTSTIQKSPQFVVVQPSKTNNLEKPCSIVTTQIRSVSVKRLQDFLGILENEYMDQVKRALAIQLNMMKVSRNSPKGP